MILLHLDTPAIAPYGELSLRTKQEYAARHGLNLSVVRDTLDPSRPPSWSKILLCKREMETAADWLWWDWLWWDWLWWLDADAAITNPEIDVRQYFDESTDMVVTADKNGICCGSFLLRNSEGARRLLDATWAQTDLIDHPWWEQAAMHRIIAKDATIRVKIIPQRTINSYPGNWQAGDLVVHLAGHTNQQRAELMKQYVK